MSVDARRTIQDIANEWQVSEATIRRWIREGRLPYTLDATGRAKLIATDDVVKPKTNGKFPAKKNATR